MGDAKWLVTSKKTSLVPPSGTHTGGGGFAQGVAWMLRSFQTKVEPRHRKVVRVV